MEIHEMQQDAGNYVHIIVEDKNIVPPRTLNRMLSFPLQVIDSKLILFIFIHY